MAPFALQSRDSGPWYRQPWPWILMSGPFVVVVAGFVTAWIAVTHQDGLVAEDYYKQGLLINRTLVKERNAGALGLAAQVAFSDDSTRVRVVISGRAVPSEQLRLRLAHATRAGLDRQVALQRAAGGWYEGILDPDGLQGKWKLLLEDGEGKWRLTGTWQAERDSAVVLEANP